MLLVKGITKIRQEKPLIHVITNPVTCNDCANVLLAIGASPVMAEDPAEVAEITQRCDSLVLNLGMLNSLKKEAMVLAGKKANQKRIPVVFDPVGVGASSFRLRAAQELMEQVRFTAIRGNASEVLTLLHGEGREKGVDASEADSFGDGLPENVKKELCMFSRRTGAVLMLSGKTDYIVSGAQIAMVKNGSAWLGRITGTGCQLSAMLGAFLAVSQGHFFQAAVSGACAMGISGEIAEGSLRTGEGSGTFHIRLLDALSLLDDKTICDNSWVLEEGK